MSLNNYPAAPTGSRRISQQLNQTQIRKQERANQHYNCSFNELLQQELGRPQGVKLSAHAEKRLQERSIFLSQEDFTKISNAVQKAAAKGSRDSLILYRDMALITNITNRTIVTAMDGKSMEEHVFTNIDSAVIIK
ncbi:TIGR02530 family flagellar biosynthesis protein [Desulforamulus putei]|uniref:Flagellar operon protein n=1 Tax=Desulforamulus putei DSM 12395 TaxID=1121429 RepID=A0A1M5B3P2_9FIRM|nr:TIGR02530 family flagellar biosynthesis protein [Desulforamulus putei]SHF37181.1 flagellar operon protein [Desulforamulus putei DSM 12395]